MKREYNLDELIYQFKNEICYYSQMRTLTACPYQKAYFDTLIENKTERLVSLAAQISSRAYDRDMNRAYERQKELTLEELASYDGAGGKPAYVAVNGVVYDVSSQVTWGGGTHFGLYAGKDLSPQFMGCHKGMIEILNKLPKVGTLKV